MKNKKRRIKYKKQRVILSDVLPFEIPLTFSNRDFYNFITENEIEINEGQLTWKNNLNNPTLDTIIELLFNVKANPNDRKIGISDQLRTVPFSFKITHKENEFRELKVIHPKNQIEMVSFYNRYKELILYYCSLSRFSIRKPDAVSKFFYFNDHIHSKFLVKNDDDNEGLVEEDETEYETLKSFFVYKRYNNIHKFFESPLYHQAEKKYNRMIKFDISKCFDSIYTHSISWAILNKEIVKDSIGESKKTFSGRFDNLMQNLNHGETNGIVVGPEFSRVFAELILQEVDGCVYKMLKKDKTEFGIHYEVFRYVDDYFLFYNDELLVNDILKAFRLCLKKYNLYFNESKVEHFQKPLITNLTIAKTRILELLAQRISFDLEVVEQNDEINNKNPEKKGSVYINSNKLIVAYKTILKETGAEYKDVMNYTLVVLERRLKNILKNYKKVSLKHKKPNDLIKSYIEVIEFVFFIYAVSPRVNATIKLCRVMRLIIESLQDRTIAFSAHKHLVFKKIFDEVNFVLKKYKMYDHTQVETLYLLLVLAELGREYWLEVDSLASYFNMQKTQNGIWHFKTDLNYFSITVLLFYIKRKKRYQEIVIPLQEHILDKFANLNIKNIRNDTERILMLFDLISCPYLDFTFKESLLNLFGVNSNQHIDVINFKTLWFTKWTDFHFGKELDAKISHEVY